MRFIKNRTILLALIVLLAAILRLWQIGLVPPSPDWDEASYGYNAYSLLKTGKDEYGKTLPIVLQSFNDYKPALYVYLVMPFILFFDVSVIAVRLPSVLAGIAAVILTYFFVREVFSFTMENKKIITPLALLSALFLAVSPWHIQFSRIGFEANVALTGNLLFYLFFLKGLKNGKFLIPAAIFAGLTVYLYQSAKVFTPLIVLAYGIIFFQELIRVQKKWLFASIIVGSLVVLPMVVFIITNPDALIRAKGVSIFYQDQTQFLRRSAERLAIDERNGDVLGKIFDNRRIEFGKYVLSNYLSHYSPDWLFFKGDSPRHHAPFMGVLYLAELPFILIGIFMLVTGRFARKTKLAISAQFFLATVPAAITFDVPSAVRTLNILPTYQIFTALGVLTFIPFMKTFKFPLTPQRLQQIPRRLVFLGVGVLALFNFFYFLNQYFVQQNYYQSQAWQYGWKEAIAFIAPRRNQYDKIIVTNKEPLDQSYMFFLYYLKVDPTLYQRAGGTGSGEFKADHSNIYNFSFRPIDWQKEEKSEKILYVGRPADFPGTVQPLQVIDYLDSSEAIKIVEGK